MTKVREFVILGFFFICKCLFAFLQTYCIVQVKYLRLNSVKIKLPGVLFCLNS
jgi:hypothetical protein